MGTKPSFYGSYISSYDTTKLCNELGASDPMPLNTRKSLKAAQLLIDKSIAVASKAFGKQLTWVDNYQEFYDELKAAKKTQDYLWTIGDTIKVYAKQFETAMVEFCKNTDNKEQLESELTTAKVGVTWNKEEKDRYWILDEGTLWMGTKTNFFWKLHQQLRCRKIVPNTWKK